MRTLLIAATGLILAVAAPAMAQQPDWRLVDEALGKQGSQEQGGVHRYSFPRQDMKVTAEGVAIKPGLALGTWFAFLPEGGGAMAMGDMVLTQNEVGPVLSKLERNGIVTTSLHQHILHAEPMPVYMHVEAHGDPARIAQGLREALSVTGTLYEAPSREAPSGTAEPEPSVKTIEQILGREGKVSGGILSISVPRAEPIRMMGVELPPAMGTAIALNFQPTGGGKVASTGDFVLVAAEVGPVAGTLRENGIQVEAVHNHMLTEEPRLFFMHYWVNDDAEKVARSLKAALDRANVKKG